MFGENVNEMVKLVREIIKRLQVRDKLVDNGSKFIEDSLANGTCAQTLLLLELLFRYSISYI